MANVVSLGDLGLEINEILDSYSIEVSDAVKKSVKSVARKTAKKIATILPATVPADPSKNSSTETQLGVGSRDRYRNSWTSQTSFESKYDIRCTVHSLTDYQLTHLLEYGHKVANQYGPVLGKNGRQVETREIDHLRTAEEYAEEELGGEINVRLG